MKSYEVRTFLKFFSKIRNLGEKVDIFDNFIFEKYKNWPYDLKHTIYKYSGFLHRFLFKMKNF